MLVKNFPNFIFFLVPKRSQVAQVIARENENAVYNRQPVAIGYYDLG